MTDNGVFRILSLGAGVQSSAVLLMSIKGDLPKLDAAIFADTGWEPKAVYNNLRWLSDQAEHAGIRIIQLGGRNIRDDAAVSQVRGKAEDGKRGASLPLFVDTDRAGGGMIRRQCTREYKIDPIEHWLRTEILGLKRRQHAPSQHRIDQWYGISSDEAHRMRDSPVSWKRQVYPLCNHPVDMLSQTMTRLECLEWLASMYPGRAFPRSACIGCPFHSNSEWLDAKRRRPSEWAEAVALDETIRHCGGTENPVYLHRSRRPLAVANLDEEQGSLWGEECEGLCGV